MQRNRLCEIVLDCPKNPGYAMRNENEECQVGVGLSGWDSCAKKGRF